MSLAISTSQQATADLGLLATAEPASIPAKGTYGQILKSSVLVGGSSALNIAIGIVRAKAMAVLLGPAGIGLFGLFSSISDLSQSIAGMGINNSGVRQIAEAVGTGDTARISRTGTVLARTSIVLGLLGAALLVFFSRQVSTFTFGSAANTGAVCLLSLAVLFRSISAGQSALLQGMRRIADLAKVSVLGALFGTLITLPCIYFFRDKGVVPSLVGIAAVTMFTSWWYSRKIVLPQRTIPRYEASHEAIGLLKLGFAFMASGFLTLGSSYCVRIIILHHAGFAATGLYQSAWTLGGMYIGFILQAMGTDFYPRLTAVARNDSECNRLVNEQMRVGLLLAGPGVIATLTFTPMVIGLFYSIRFVGAVEVLRWICLGTILQVVTWPVGFIVIAKGRQTLFFLSDLAWSVVYLALVWFGVEAFGLAGAGMAFFASYIFHALLSGVIARNLTGFSVSRENLATGAFFLALIAIVFSTFYLLPSLVAAAIGLCCFLLSSLYSVRTLLSLVSFDRIPRPFRILLNQIAPRPQV